VGCVWCYPPTHRFSKFFKINFPNFSKPIFQIFYFDPSIIFQCTICTTTPIDNSRTIIYPRHIMIDIRTPSPDEIAPGQLPEWLSAYPTKTEQEIIETPRYPRTADERELERLTFESLFEIVMDGLTEGMSPKRIVERDPRGVSFGRWYQWMKRDPDRLKRYQDAQESSAEVLLVEMQDIADGDPDSPPEDVQRSNLRINVRKFRVQAYNRQRYGDKQQVEVKNDTTIEIRTLLDARAQRLARLGLSPTGNEIEGEAQLVG